MNLIKAVVTAAIVGAVSVAGAEKASAAPIQLQFNIVALGSILANTGVVTTATTITNGAPTIVGAIQLNNIGLTPGTTTLLSPNPMGVTVGSVFTLSFASAAGTFVETLTVTSATPTPNALGVRASGTIIQTLGSGFDPTPIFWSAAYTQSQGPGSQINASFSTSTTPPPPQVPEPTSMVLLGMGLLGAATMRLRRRK